MSFYSFFSADKNFVCHIRAVTKTNGLVKSKNKYGINIIVFENF